MARHSYESIRTHAADLAAMQSLVDDDLAGFFHADDPRCACCGTWLGYLENDWCTSCRFGDDDRV
jgi:hypothetical protein